MQECIGRSSVVAPSVSLPPKLRVKGTQAEHVPSHLRTFVRLLSSWVYRGGRVPGHAVGSGVTLIGKRMFDSWPGARPCPPSPLSAVASRRDAGLQRLPDAKQAGARRVRMEIERPSARARAPRSMKTWSVPLTRTSVTPGSFRSGSSGPAPTRCRRNDSTVSSTAESLTTRPSARMAVATSTGEYCRPRPAGPGRGLSTRTRRRPPGRSRH
jgi:hypothetical protein